MKVIPTFLRGNSDLQVAIFLQQKAQTDDQGELQTRYFKIAAVCCCSTYFTQYNLTNHQGEMF